MGLAMEPQCQRMAIGSGSFQACPNFWHVGLLEDPSQLSKAFGVVSKAKAHPLATCSQLGLHAGFGHVEAKHRQCGSNRISRVHCFVFLSDFSFWFIGRLGTRSCWLSRTPGIGDMLVCALFLGWILRWIRCGFTSRR